VRKNEIQLVFGQEERPLTLMLKIGMPVANNYCEEIYHCSRGCETAEPKEED
jgi:hypothetical protein